jgi:glycosyltransferase involved in cell wall biosynthesis
MRVLMLSKALIVGQYQAKAQALAHKPAVELTVVVPPRWRDERGVMQLEKKYSDGYRFIVAPLRLNGNYHLHLYPTIGEIIARVKPDLIHLDEEPYNLATFHALLAARRHAPNARVLFFTWQNLLRSYPLPFVWTENYVYAHTDYALAGSQAASDVLRAKGFTKPLRVIPQFGVDPDTYTPGMPRTHASDRRVIGFAGRLVPEKGATLLLRALARLEGNWELRIMGSGPEQRQLERLAQQLRIGERVQISPWQPSAQMPDFFRQLDVFVAPSLSRPNWIEQFGRVLIEAMACGIPVIGSSCGEIPNVIGDAGVVFQEGAVVALTEALRALLNNPARRAQLGACGRERVLARFTQQRIVDETYEVYRQLAGQKG